MKKAEFVLRMFETIWADVNEDYTAGMDADVADNYHMMHRYIKKMLKKKIKKQKKPRKPIFGNTAFKDKCPEEQLRYLDMMWDDYTRCLDKVDIETLSNELLLEWYGLHQERVKGCMLDE